ncbi:helix-turn-helix domain-containing protein [Phascolarctobacterium sp.]
MEGLDPLKIGEAIKIKRIQKRITQSDLARQLGLSQTHLSNAENGRVMLSLKALLRVKEILGCTLDELIDTGTGKKKKPRRYRLVRWDD